MIFCNRTHIITPGFSLRYEFIFDNTIGMRQMRNHLLASEGYCVVSIDSRGSHNRGTAFEAHLRHRMGQVSF